MSDQVETSSLFYSEIISPLLHSIKEFSERNAFCINNIFYTYAQFGEYISKIRAAFQKLNFKEKYIGLVTNDDIETYASIFALWLEGKAYVPLQPNQPMDRCSEIISQIGITTILDSTSVSRFNLQNRIDTSGLVFEKSILDYQDIFEDETDAYVLFTSGSTGTPKGVRISRNNLGSFMDSFWDCDIQISKEDKCLQCFDLTFDVSVQSFIAPLIRGACVFTVPHDQIKYSYVYGLLEDHQITFGAMAPSMIRYLKPYFDEIHLPQFKYCILTGEASPIDLVDLWKKCVPNAQIFDFYGPTETTIYCTCYQFRRDGENKTLNGMLSIGEPMKNVRAIIVDENREIVAEGEKGELCISGGHVSPGYWNQPERNHLAFFEKEIEKVTHIFYHTGDLCFLDKDKNLMLFGRLDSQTKIQGFRVELGEIEFQVREYLKGNNAVVLTFINAIGNTELALFMEGEGINSPSLLNHLKSKLPFYMIPTQIVELKEFALNANGKIDKQKLKERLINLSGKI